MNTRIDANRVVRALAFLLVGASTQRVLAQEPFEPVVCLLDRQVEVRFENESAELADHGRSARAEYAVEFTGGLHISIDALGDSNPYLRVEDSAGNLLGEDDDSGGGKSAYLQLEVAPGQRIVAIVARGAWSTLESLQVKFAAAPDSERSQAVAAQAMEDLRRIRGMLQAGEVDAAREALTARIDGLLAASDVATSDDWNDALLDCAEEAESCELLEAAITAWSAVLTHGTRVLPHDHEIAQKARSRLASNLYQVGDLEGARELEEIVLEVCSRTMPENHEDRLSSQTNLAITIFDLGEIAPARTLFENVLAIESRSRADDDEELQYSRGNLAIILRDTGDLAGARALEEKVLEVLSRKLDADDSRLQNARQNLALTRHALGDDDAARELLENVLEVRDRTLPDEHPARISARTNLALIEHALGEYSAALALERANLAVCSRTLDDDNPDLQSVRQNLATTLQEVGELDEARELFEKVFEVRSRRLPRNHPDLRSALANLALVSAKSSATDAARRVVLELCTAENRSIDSALLELSPRQIAQLDRQFTNSLAIVLSITMGYRLLDPDPEVDRATFELLAGLRAVDLASAGVIRLANSNQALASKRDEMLAASEAVTNAVGVAVTPSEVQSAVARKDLAQRSLLESVKDEPEVASLVASPSLEALASRLPAGDALVTFLRCGLRARDLEDPRVDIASDRIVAFVVRADRSLAKFDLGPAQRITETAHAWRDAVGVNGQGASRTSAEIRAAGQGLRHAVIDPLRPALGDTKRWILCLDDVLHAIPIDALPANDDPQSNRCLGDEIAIEVRASLRELLVDSPARRGSPALVALGDAAFNEAPIGSTADDAVASAAPDSTPYVSGILRGSAWKDGFKPLTQTGPEVAGIRDLFDRAFEKAPEGFVLSRRRACREALAALAPEARYLHIATHGWFAPESIRSFEDRGPLDAKLGTITRMTAQEQVIGASPMVLCGLALAGANLPPDVLGRHPGLVTAEEIATWDLMNCELAVLSACDTNVGISRAGQGVFSLQKALQMAGARSVITSLWKVPDRATKELMLEFYRHLWELKEPKREALWAAKMHLREMTDAEGEPVFSERDWAGWVLTGEPD